MCGISGIFLFDRHTRIDEDKLRAMNARIVHRGPDDQGFYVDGNVGLAMRRLSIVDLQTGQQPVSNEDGSIHLVYNGEIYNHVPLREMLRSRGHNYRSRSDTETIVHLFEERGRDCVQDLRGMFAFAIWNAGRRQLLLARDRLGIKPLYFARVPHGLIFASEIKSLLEYPGIRAQLNPNCVSEYLAFGYISTSDTLFEGIEKLPPGHTLEADESGNVTIKQYWDLTDKTANEIHGREYYTNTYRHMLEDAVASHLMSDVPLGVFLSGGLDSSVIAALATKLRGERIQTFSVGYDDAHYSELPYAREVANSIGSIHHEVRLSGDEFFQLLPKLVWHEDEPIVWPSSVALYAVARLARNSVKVVLTGEGSDETLAGYTRYGWTRWNAALDRIYRSLVPSVARRSVRSVIGDSTLLSAELRRKLSHTFLARDGSSFASFYFDNFYSAFPEPEQSSLLTDEYLALSRGAYDRVLEVWESSSLDPVSRLLYTDIKTYLVELLMKQDSMSMAASVESRVPFLDHPLVEFALTIPSTMNLRGLSGKQVLKMSARDLLPDSILFRKKMGFPTPLTTWLKGRYLNDVEGILMESRTLGRRILRTPALKKVFAEHRSGARDNTDRIWRLLNLELWHRVFVDRDAAVSIQDNSRRSSSTQRVCA